MAVGSVDVSLDVKCVSSLDVESSSSGSELVDFCEVLVDSLNTLDSVGAGESGLYSDMNCAFGLTASSLAAE